MAADVWSATSWNELRRDALACDEWNSLTLRSPSVSRTSPPCWKTSRARWWPSATSCGQCPDQIAPWLPNDYVSLGTDGFGASDVRAALRRHFHVDTESITLAVPSMLERRGEVKRETLQQAIARYQLRDDQTAGQHAAPEAAADGEPDQGEETSHQVAGEAEADGAQQQ